MSHLALALATLACIVWASLCVGELWKKGAIFLGLGVANVLLLVQAGYANEAWEVYGVEFAQFIPIPVCAVLAAGLGLFGVVVRDKSVALGWFLFLACPIIGNFGTTWSLVPVVLSLVPVLRSAYPDR